MKKFAKLYNTDLGQILVKLDGSETFKPEIKYYFQPKGLGVCSTGFSFEDSDKGWASAENTFKKIEKKGAYKVVKKILDDLDLA